MSLLLDALKKSEAQRRRGRLPSVDLGSIPARPAASPPRRRWTWSMLPLAVIAVAVWQWPAIERLFEAPGAAAPALAVPAPAPADSPPGEADPVSLQAVDADQSEPAPARTTEVRAASIDSISTSPGSTASSAAADADIPESTPAGARQSSTQATETAAGPGSAPGRSETESAPGSGEQAEADPALDGVILPWELPQARRAEFPELELTVHYFASRPGDRFVLINGERYRQGERLGGGVRIREIVARGVVLEFGSYLVLLE